MRRLTGFLFFCFTLTFISCRQETKPFISIEVTLLHLPDSAHIAYLDVIQPANTWVVDTAKIDPLKGTFHFSVHSGGSEELYRIRLGHSSPVLLALNNNDVKVTGDYNHPDQLNIEGSRASEELQHFLTRLNVLNNTIHNLKKDYALQIKNQAKDSILQAQSQQIQEKEKALQDTLLHKARTTQSPVNAVFALSLFNQSPQWEQSKVIFDALPQRFPNNQLVKQALTAYRKKLNRTGKGLAIDIGDQAPELSYPNPGGKIISLSDFKGKYVLIDFWASWCAPCREENPNLVKAWKRFKDSNFTILGVSLDSKKSSWTEAIQKDQLTWSQISDLKGWNAVPAATYGVEAIPANFLINPEGKVIAKDLRGDTLMNKLNILLSP